MIPITSITRALLGIVLDGAKEALFDSFKDQALKQTKEQFFKAQLPAFKALVAEQVANAYAEQIKEKSEAYVEAVENMNLEAEFDNEISKDFVILAQNALRKLEVYIESQGQDGPIISYLKDRYTEEGIKRITGRLYAGHYIRRQGEGVYSIYNRMAYAPLVDKNKPWLSSDTTAQGISDLIAEKATEYFAEEFDIDMGGDAAEIYKD